MSDINELLNIAKKNKKKRTHEHKEVSYCKLNADESYPAFIVDAEYNEDDSIIELKVVIIKDTFKIERTFSFKLFNGCSVRYDNICETLGTGGDPSDLIGKFVYMHIERNGDFQNLHIEAEMDRSEFEELISDINKKSTKAKKTTKSNKTLKPHSFEDEIDEDDDLEEEFLDDEEEEE